MTRRTKAQLLEAKLEAKIVAASLAAVKSHRPAENGTGITVPPAPPPPSSGKVALTVLMIVADIAVILVALVFLLRMWLS